MYGTWATKVRRSLPAVGDRRDHRVADLLLELRALALALVEAVPVERDLEAAVGVEPFAERAEDGVAAAAHRAGGGGARQGEQKNHEAEDGARAARRKRLPVQDAILLFESGDAGGTSRRRADGSAEKERNVIERAGRSEAAGRRRLRSARKRWGTGGVSGAAADRTAGCGAARASNASPPDPQVLNDGALVGRHRAARRALRRGAWPQAIAHRIASVSWTAAASRRPASSATAASTKAAIGRCIAPILARWPGLRSA